MNQSVKDLQRKKTWIISNITIDKRRATHGNDNHKGFFLYFEVLRLNSVSMESIIYHPVFLTATIKAWKNLLKPEKYKNIILTNLQKLVHDRMIILYAYCIMDNHIHLIWQIIGEHLPSEIQKKFLENISKQIKKDLEVNHLDVLKVFSSTQKDRSYHFWKRRALSIELFTQSVFDQKLDYIHNNPVNAGISKFPEQYIYSSARFYYHGTDEWNMLTHYNR